MYTQATEYARAMSLMSQPAEDGCSEAQRIIGFLHEHGKGCPQDIRQAESWYLRASKAGAAPSPPYLHQERDYPASLSVHH
jgi:TPR repeat protein